MLERVMAPAEGELIEVNEDGLKVPDRPIIGAIWGDGIGPDIMRASLQVWDAAVERAYGGRRKIAWTRLYAGEEAFSRYGHHLPEDTLRAISQFKVAIKGPLATPVAGGIRSLNVALRQRLDLYACVRPVRWYPGVPSPLRQPHRVDVVIFRENTEDLYAGIEWPSGSEEARRVARWLNQNLGTAIDEEAGIGVKVVTERGTKRLVRRAIRYALERGRRNITIVHKGNIQKFTEGAFLKWAYQVAREEFEGLTVTEEEALREGTGGKLVVKDRIADIMFQQMLLRPEEYDVIATLNLNGDYLSDAIAAEVGGVGIAPGANLGDQIALFEATHGTAPKYANQDRANPGSLLLSGVMMLEYLGWREAAQAIVRAYIETVGQKIATYDFARQMEGAREVKTSEFAAALIANL